MLPGLADPLTMISFAVPFCNIATPLVGKMAYLRHTNFLDIQYKTLYQPTTTHSYLSGNAPLPQLNSNNRTPYNHLLLSITLMLTHCPTSMLDHMLLYRTHAQTKIWDIYGTVTEISPQRRYYIKTKGGRVLVCNRRFLRRHIPTSIPTDISQAGSNQPPTQQSSTLRRSSRDKRSTR